MTYSSHAVFAARSGARSAEPPARRLPFCTTHDLLWFFYLYPLRLIAAVVPRAWLYLMGRLAEPLVQFHWRRRRRSAARRIITARSCTAREAARIARQSVSNNMFRILDDLLLFRPAFPKKLHCTAIDGMQHLERAISSGKGVIVLTGHFGANRIAERYLAAIGHSMLSVHNQEPSNRAEGLVGRRILQPRYLELQRRAHNDVVYIQDADCSLKIFRRLRSGGLVNIQLDGLAGARSVEGLLLGAARRFPAGVFDFARLSGCAVVPMLCLGGSAGFQIHFSPMLEVIRAASRDEFVSVNLPVFTQALEKQIADHPEEWRLWTHF